MSWGTESWGVDPWGGFTPSADAPVPPADTISINSITFIAQDVVSIGLSVPVRVDSLFQDSTNYSIAPLDFGEPVNIVSVFIPQNTLVTDTVMIKTTPHTVGGGYSVGFTRLVNPDGASLSLTAASKYQARVSKTMVSLKSLPSHFDKRPESLIRNLITAISLQDDIIGGSRSDEFES